MMGPVDKIVSAERHGPRFQGRQADSIAVIRRWNTATEKANARPGPTMLEKVATAVTATVESVAEIVAPPPPPQKIEVAKQWLGERCLPGRCFRTLVGSPDD
jgi:hypothetical protein